MKRYVIKEDKTGYFVRQNSRGILGLSKGESGWYPPTTFDLDAALHLISNYRKMKWNGYVSMHNNLFSNGNLAKLALRPIKLPNNQIISFEDLN